MTPTSDDLLRQLLQQTRTIAVVGYSTNPAKAGAYVPAYLAAHGYDVTGVNPVAEGAPLPTVPSLDALTHTSRGSGGASPSRRRHTKTLSKDQIFA
jgi:predicted CoA-binding protein